MSERYFAHPGINNSAMKEIIKSPAHFIQWVKNLPEASKKPHFRIGQALHDLILGTGSRIKIFDKTKTMMSVSGEKFLAEFHPQHICLTVDEHETVQGMERSIRAEPMIMELINRSEKEVEIYGQELTPYGMLPAKAMIDCLGPTWILDLKSSSDELQWFPRKARQLYPIQAAWYKHRALMHDGIDRDFYFIAVETAPPHGVRLFKASNILLADGQEKYQKAIETYSKCMAEGNWPIYDTSIVEEI